MKKFNQNKLFYSKKKKKSVLEEIFIKKKQSKTRTLSFLLNFFC